VGRVDAIRRLWELGMRKPSITSGIAVSVSRFFTAGIKRI